VEFECSLFPSCRKFVSHHIDGELRQELRANTYKGMAFRNDRFKEELEIKKEWVFRKKLLGNASNEQQSSLILTHQTIGERSTKDNIVPCCKPCNTRKKF